MVSEEILFKYLFPIFLHYGFHDSQYKRAGGWVDKLVWLIQDFSMNISIKVLSKYLQSLGSKCRFSIFSIKGL